MTAVTPNTEEQNFVDTVLALEPYKRCVVLLMCHALLRKDNAIFEGLVSYGNLPEGPEEDLGEPDMAALGRLAAVCDKKEKILWGRCLAQAYMAGDRSRLEALMALIRQRASN